MAKKVLYNVGMITIGTAEHNLFNANSDGQDHLLFRKADEYFYVSRDFVLSQIERQKAILDNRVNVSMLDNASAPAYSVGGHVSEIGRAHV